MRSILFCTIMQVEKNTVQERTGNYCKELTLARLLHFSQLLHSLCGGESYGFESKRQRARARVTSGPTQLQNKVLVNISSQALPPSLSQSVSQSLTQLGRPSEEKVPRTPV